MSIEFNITTANEFFLGEDKEIAWQIFGPDDQTPINISGWPLEFTLKKTDKSADAILTKTIGDGLEISGLFAATAETNAQRVVATFSSADTATLKPNTAYRYRVKRIDEGNVAVLAFGSLTFLP